MLSVYKISTNFSSLNKKFFLPVSILLCIVLSVPENGKRYILFYDIAFCFSFFGGGNETHA